MIGLEVAKDVGVKILNIKGDSDLIILQVWSPWSNFLVSAKENFKDQKIELACERNFDKVYSKSEKGTKIVMASSSRKSHNLAFKLWIDRLDVKIVPRRHNSLDNKSVVSVSTLQLSEELPKRP